MIPPAYFAAQKIIHEGMQAVPNMESDGSVKPPNDSLFSECVLDLSRYLSSSDLPATPGEFFDDLFHGKVTKTALQKHLPGVIKIKEESDSTATSRCSTPESLLPEHDFDNGDFPTPKFQDIGTGSHLDKGESLMCQLHSIPNSNVSSDNDSDTDINVDDLSIDAKKLKAVLIQLEQNEICPGSVSPSHKNSFKSPRHKVRKVMSKGSEEYMVKRERNNVAVRKSRTKAKLKHIETQMRVGELTEENEQLRNHVSALQKELDAMKSFITYNASNNGKIAACFSSYPGLFSSTKMM